VSSLICRITGLAALVLLCDLPADCARPVGDLGRAAPSVLHDEIMPALGAHRRDGGAVSGFNLSDEERDMHNRVWRFLVAPHAEDWFMDTAVELQRTRLAAAKAFHPERYYKWLHAKPYASSRVRYSTVADHIQSDINTAPQTFAAICRVIELDRQRALASRSLDGLSATDVAARRAENEVHIGWFASALRYRHDAYGLALDRLLVETPHAEAVDAEARLTTLAIWVERAKRRDFCGDAGGWGAGRDGGRALPSRVLMPAPDEGGYRK
jgi:hypothetical protein